MKLVINTTNINGGGGFQRAISFIKELKLFGEDEYYIFHRMDLIEQIEIDSFPENFHFYCFDDSPASFIKRFKLIKKFDFLVNFLKPDLVFSFVGPAYWKPKGIPHFVGYAVPHIVYNDLNYYKKVPLKMKIEMFYKKLWTKYEADYWVVQTEDVRQRLAKRINVNLDKISLVTNGIGIQYNNVDVVKSEFKTNIRKLLTISNFRHTKNLQIIKKVLPLLANDSFKYEFHLTIKQVDYDKYFKGYEKSIINHGNVKAIDCPALYNQCDAMFLPTHLECFSASYPEAMKMEKPIITSNLSFAHTVCKDAAIYFDNLDASDIANKIKKLFHNMDLYDDLIKKGRKQLLTFDTSKKQAEMYINICKQIKKN